jgi:hypothetical protein
MDPVEKIELAARERRVVEERMRGRGGDDYQKTQKHKYSVMINHHEFPIKVAYATIHGGAPDDYSSSAPFKPQKYFFNLGFEVRGWSPGQR